MRIKTSNDGQQYLDSDDIKKRRELYPSVYNNKDVADDSAIINELERNCFNKKLTISGGEPLLQYPAVLELIKKLKFFDITLYTGYDLQDVPKEILHHINYIKVGHFIEKERTTVIPFIGSKNQKFINLKGELNEIY